MARTGTVTPRVQTARPREKTFTRHPLDTLGSHPSCISARYAPNELNGDQFRRAFRETNG